MLQGVEVGIGELVPFAYFAGHHVLDVLASSPMVLVFEAFDASSEGEPFGVSHGGHGQALFGIGDHKIEGVLLIEVKQSFSDSAMSSVHGISCLSP
jgi:hypothetical protein